jgi:hypothetical protein
MPDIKKIPLIDNGTDCILIAEASTRDPNDEGQRRWTDLEVWHRPGQSPRFVAVSVGVSSFTHEVDRERRLGGSSLSKVLRMFEGSDGAEPSAIGRHIIAQAKVWESDTLFDGSTVTEAMAWLYQGLELGESVASRAARDLDITPRPVQRAIKAESEGEEATLTVPLLELLRYIDRDRFQADSVARAAKARAGAIAA